MYYFISGLFNDTVSSSDYIALNDIMIREKLIENYEKGSGHGLILGHNPSIWLEGLRKTMNTSVIIASLQTNI
jgi:hypothetical protein